jgi:hypothetical protein
MFCAYRTLRAALLLLPVHLQLTDGIGVPALSASASAKRTSLSVNGMTGVIAYSRSVPIVHPPIHSRSTRRAIFADIAPLAQFPMCSWFRSRALRQCPSLVAASGAARLAHLRLGRPSAPRPDQRRRCPARSSRAAWSRERNGIPADRRR